MNEIDIKAHILAVGYNLQKENISQEEYYNVLKYDIGEFYNLITNEEYENRD